MMLGILIAASSLKGANQEILVTDSSASGCPLSLSGKLAFSDTGPENTPYSISIREIVKNRSSRSVLLLGLTVNLEYGISDAPQRYKNDYYFSSQVLQPGAVSNVDLSLPRYGPRRSETGSTPQFSATASVDFVQFSDGRTWGDESELGEMLPIRRLTYYALGMLRREYDLRGDDGFASEVMKPSYSSLPGIVALQNLYRQRGADGAETTAWKMIEAAKQHQEEIDSAKVESRLRCSLPFSRF